MDKNIVNVIGYVRVSTKEQEDNPRYNFQENYIRRLAEGRPWNLEIHREVVSGKNISKRKVFREILDKLSRKEADTLIVYAVDRLTRSMDDGKLIYKKSKDEGWLLYPLDLPKQGEVAEEMWIKLYENKLSDAQYELGVLSRRTREGMSQSKNKDFLGSRRFPTYSEESIERVRYLRRNRKLTYQRIAEILNDQGLLPCRTDIYDNKWNLQSVRKLCTKFNITKEKNHNSKCVPS
jgi:DNA invertase Pin-like site-specific DNA recombinase